jgi:hypothetical protein
VCVFCSSSRQVFLVEHLRILCTWLCLGFNITSLYRGADKSLARPGRKQTRVTENFDNHISYL